MVTNINGDFQDVFLNSDKTAWNLKESGRKIGAGEAAWGREPEDLCMHSPPSSLSPPHAVKGLIVHYSKVIYFLLC